MMRTVRSFEHKIKADPEAVARTGLMIFTLVGFGILAYMIGGPEIVREALRSIGGP